MLEPNVTVIVERSLATFFTKSDPEHFVVLPPKISESELVTERKVPVGPFIVLVCPTVFGWRPVTGTAYVRYQGAYQPPVPKPYQKAYQIS